MNPDCFTTHRDFGRDIITDLCNSTQRVVEWGQLDYFQAGFIQTLELGFVTIALIVTWKFFRR